MAPFFLLLALLLLLAQAVLPGCSTGEGGKPAGSSEETDSGDGGSPDAGTPDGAAEGEGEGEEDSGPGPEEDSGGSGPACVPLDGPLGPMVQLRFEPDGHFFARPFPDDSRTSEEGRVIVEGFPNPGRSEMLDQLLEMMQEETSGWASNGALYLSFSGRVHPGSLPLDPASTLEPDATVFLAELGEDGSPGKRIPLELRYEDEETLFLLPHTLAAYPVPGFVPRGGVRHALVVTTGLLDAACRPLHEARGELRAGLQRAGLDPAGLAGAAIFTPQDVLGLMLRIKEAVDALDNPRARSLRHEARAPLVDLYQGDLEMPSFQEGEPPYLAPGSGGGIVWREDGTPQVQRYEQVRFSLTVPRSGEPPAGGWPILIYSHGTGGDFESVLDAVALDLGARGIAAIGFDQVLHGPRDPSGSPPELSFFNVINMVAGRDNVLQGGVDGLVMLRFVRSLVVPLRETPDSVPVRIDGQQVLFMGHSQGGITGAPFVAVAKGLKGALFSGTSGLLRITILEREDLEFAILPGIERYKDLVERFLGIEGQEELDMFHPVLTLVQTFIEPADTLSYAPYFHRLREEEQRVPVLILEGFSDHASPAMGIEALAVAAGADLVEPVARRVYGLELLGREPVSPPVQANWDGVTAGLSQYPQQGHFAFFRDAAAKQRGLTFLRSALDRDQPVIE